MQTDSLAPVPASPLIDTHAHLDFPDFANEAAGEPQAVIDRAVAAGVKRIVTIGTGVESSRRAVGLAERFPAVFAAVGIHPGCAVEELAEALKRGPGENTADENGEAPPDAERPSAAELALVGGALASDTQAVDRAVADIVARLRELARAPRVVAVGEIGLDYYRLPGEDTPVAAAQTATIKAAQARLFTAQLGLAAELGLNVVIHQRGDCMADTLRLLEPFNGRLRAVFHCFGGTPEEALRLLDAGHLVSFTGIVTFKNAPLMQATAAAVPDGSFMVETDCPYLAPVPFRGKRCEPAHTRQVAEKIAALRGQTVEHVAQATTATAEAFFRFPP